MFTDKEARMSILVTQFAFARILEGLWRGLGVRYLRWVRRRGT